jgi:hypothetical protein
MTLRLDRKGFKELNQEGREVSYDQNKEEVHHNKASATT